MKKLISLVVVCLVGCVAVPMLSMAALVGGGPNCQSTSSAPTVFTPNQPSQAGDTIDQPPAVHPEMAQQPAQPDYSQPSTTDAGPCNDISGQGWTQPVHGPVGSGFRTENRPRHDGVDLIVARHTPILAAAAGTVATIRCDIEPTSWGCDRDGSPQTPGCGWYLDILHIGGILTRYCHLLMRPFVQQGDAVTAGQVIGVVGSSGHSSGPHLHYEVHAGGQRSDTAINPVDFMAANCAPLGENASAAACRFSSYVALSQMI